MKKSLIAGVLILMVTPSFTKASFFSDDFHRPDSASTGNGWVDTSVGSGPISSGILNNISVSTSNNNGGPWSYRTDVPETSGIAIKGEFSSANLSDGYYKVGEQAAGGYNNSGYNIAMVGQNNTLEINDESGGLAETSFSFNDSDIFAYEWDITASPQNWSYLYVWDVTNGTKPLTPTLSWTNVGNDFTPAVSGNRFYFLTGLQGLVVPVETMYTYLFEVDPLDTTPPSLTAVSISSSNASTTLAKVGDTVTLNFDASEAVETPVVTIAGRVANVATTTGNSFTASTTMLASDSDGAIPFSVSLTDLAGNVGFTTSTTTDGSSVALDKTPPIVSITGGPADGATSTSADIRFEFSVDDPTATLLCAFDYATTSPCASPFATTTTDGSHVFSITASDPAGNSASTSRTFAVNIPTPIVSSSDASADATGSLQANSKSSGGGQPVGSSPTAPGYQTTAPIVSQISSSSTQNATSAVLSFSNTDQASSAPEVSAQTIPETSQTQVSKRPPEAPTLSAENLADIQNQAAVAQSGLDLSGWAWPAFLILLLLIDCTWLYLRIRRN